MTVRFRRICYSTIFTCGFSEGRIYDFSGEQNVREKNEVTDLCHESTAGESLTALMLTSRVKNVSC